MTLATVMAAAGVTKSKLSDQRIVIFGAGTAASASRARCAMRCARSTGSPPGMRINASGCSTDTASSKHHSAKVRSARACATSCSRTRGGKMRRRMNMAWSGCWRS